MWFLEKKNVGFGGEGWTCAASDVWLERPEGVVAQEGERLVERKPILAGRQGRKVLVLWNAVIDWVALYDEDGLIIEGEEPDVLVNEGIEVLDFLR